MAVDFYRNCEARFVRIPPHLSPDRLRELARRSASLLAEACPSPRVGTSLRRLVLLSDSIRVPLFLHLVYIDRRPIWILLTGTTISNDARLFEGSFYVNEFYMLLPWSGECLYHTIWL
jgi:hypothetical protein